MWLEEKSMFFFFRLKLWRELAWLVSLGRSSSNNSSSSDDILSCAVVGQTLVYLLCLIGQNVRSLSNKGENGCPQNVMLKSVGRSRSSERLIVPRGGSRGATRLCFLKRNHQSYCFELDCPWWLFFSRTADALGRYDQIFCHTGDRPEGGNYIWGLSFIHC